MFSPSYDRYDKTTKQFGNTGMAVLVPKIRPREAVGLTRGSHRPDHVGG